MTTKDIPVSELPADFRKHRRGSLPVDAKSFDYWEVQGMSWAGNPTKRAGKWINCGHEHESQKACDQCVISMRKERPGKCQVYRTVRVQGYLVGYKIGNRTRGLVSKLGT
jgi:hypothetical protein